MGNFNFLRWVILQSDETITGGLNEPLAKLFVTKNNGYWERLVNMDIDRRIFPFQF